MQTVPPASSRAAVFTTRSRCESLVVRADGAVASRRKLALIVIAVPLLAAVRPARARNYLDAKKAAEERKEKLKQAAEGMKEKGVTKEAFENSGYAVSEDAHTPNAHSRQEEGIRKQENI